MNRKLILFFGLCMSVVLVLASFGGAGTQPVFGNKKINTKNTDYDTGMGSVEIGDIDEEYPGNEIIYTGYGWGTAYAYWNGTDWESKLLWNRSYQVWYSPALEVGDLVAEVPGVEVVEALYEVIVLTYDNATGNWTNETVWEPWAEIGSTVGDIQIGDFDPVHPGNEMAVTTHLLHEIYKEPNGTWCVKYVGDPPPNADIYECTIGDVDPRFDGNEIVVFTAENVSVYAWNGTGWRSEIIDVSFGIVGDVGAGKVCEMKSGNNASEIVCGNKWGELIMAWWNETRYEVAMYVRCDGHTNALGVGDLWSGHEGIEIVVGLYDGRVYLVWEDNGSWNRELILNDGYLYDVEVGEFDSQRDGVEIAVAAYGLYEVYEDTSVDENININPVIVVLICVPAVLWKLKAGREWK
ncbi:MAG: hypothetical protein N3F63_08170 [Thermoplasmata archaeon]|nr:hypothetical protein [Thermoplasmata archaeon]